VVISKSHVTLVLAVVSNQLVNTGELNLVADEHFAGLRLSADTEVFYQGIPLFVVLSAYR
jgi:hypothetical protein